ncbi:hypothetical protein G3O08_16960 [Cryomorpha ignava]|uniref:Gliding motility-associated C-terminal domain-containing protein n=1 Tax=Cryomorpha ignava TaxID=101383 RepID=A0A7K3WUL2_9FLAO|nr:gliding motility-associated C-terminal domain-containing protein [Cryomorpha ignava]NEN25194.1 hypothetical protein [Cryomorpha ignava]
MKKRVLIFRFWFAAILSVIMAVSAKAQVLEPPNLLCASVVNGEVVLTWEIPANSQPSHFYRIQRDLNDGTGFTTIIDGLAFTSTTYTDNAAVVDPGAGKITYRIQTYGSGSSAWSSKVSTIFLTLPNIGTSIAQLSWNAPYDPPPTTGSYQIYRNIEGDGEIQVGTVSPSITTYADTLFGLCDQDDPNRLFAVEYRVSYQRPECEMFSNLNTGNYKDELPPEYTEIETVSVDPFTGFTNISWYPITNAPDLIDYTIKEYFSTTEQEVIGVVYVYEGVNYWVFDEDDNLNDATSFQILAHDTCGQELGLPPFYTTMRANSSYQDCDQFIELIWTNYTGWDEGVEKQNIYVNKDNAGYQIVETVSNVQNAIQLDIEPNSSYCIYVEAVSNGSQRPSTTNATCVDTDYPEVIDFNYLNRVTTVDEKRIQIDLLQDVNGNGTTYQLLRAKGDDPFLPFGTYSETNNPLITVFDTDVNASNTVYRYKWKAFDGCGAELAESNTGKNIVLTGITTSQNLINSLQWTNYSTWDGGVDEYRVLRKLGSELDFSLLTTFGPGQFSYEEDIEAFLLEEGEFCYKIVAVEGTNQFGSETTSESNEVCVTQEPLMWIPNTIVLDGYNKVFKPVAGFIDFESYEMEIYNKWGQKIFASSDIEEGWDGTYKGNNVASDYYRYIIVYRDGSGKSYLKQGVLYVIV